MFDRQPGPLHGRCCQPTSAWVGLPPTPSTLIEPGGTYILIPYHLKPPPPHLGKGYNPYLGYWLYTIGNYRKPHLFRAFSGILPETTAKKYPLSRQKWEYPCGPLMHLRGGGCLFPSVIYCSSLVAKWCLSSYPSVLLYLYLNNLKTCEPPMHVKPC